MGMFFNKWAEEEEEEWKSSGLSWEQFKVAKRFYQDNHIHNPIKKARFRGIELSEGDIITPNIDSNNYIIRDFKGDGTPIVDLVSHTQHDYINKEYEFLKFFKVGCRLNEL